MAFAVIAATLACGARDSGAVTTLSAPLPPDLVALEQQMAQIQANSERFSFQEEFSFGELLGPGSPLILVLTGEGEASNSPPQVAVSGGLLGFPQTRVRAIGDVVYTYQPHAAALDGGRPWVRSRRATGQAAPELDPAGLLESAQPGKQGTFSQLIEQLNHALAIHESGPVTVDDQRVTEFDAALDPAPFLAKLEAASPEPQHPLESALEIPTPGGSQHPAKEAPAPTLELELFIAPNGLPVRARFTFAAEGATLAMRVDTLAINVPVHVTPPPASETIDEARLKRLERRRAARELRRALRRCRRLHGKRRAGCRALARARSRALRAVEPSPF